MVIAESISNTEAVSTLTGASWAECLPAYLAINLKFFLTASVRNPTHIRKILRDKSILGFTNNMSLFPTVSVIVVAIRVILAMRVISSCMVSWSRMMCCVRSHCMSWSGMEWLWWASFHVILLGLGKV